MFKKRIKQLTVAAWLSIVALISVPALAQLIDRTRYPNTSDSGIAKSLQDQIGTGQGDSMTPDSSCFIINRDPFRAIRRGRQLFQRKFLQSQGQGPLSGNGIGDININIAIGAGMVDSCSTCHGRPRGAAGFGGDVATRPDSRDAPHLFGLGLKEMLADEITADLREIRAKALLRAKRSRNSVTRQLTSKGINFGTLTAYSDGSVDTSQVQGVDSDLRVRPFFFHGGTASIREFVAGAFNDEMGMQAVDPVLMRAHNGERVTTLSGMVLDGSLDKVNAPPTDDPHADPDGDGITNELPASLVDFMEFYLLNYFKPATYQQTSITRKGREVFQQIGCAQCHIPDLPLLRDRRVADVETVYDPVNGIYNNLFASATPLFTEQKDTNLFPSLKRPRMNPFLVKNIFTDFKRHDIGPSFYERGYDGEMRTHFITTPLWGVGSTPPYGHDGRSINLMEVILRHGGEAQASRDAFARLALHKQSALVEFLNSLVIFPPDDTASNLDPGDRNAANYQQYNHGSIKLSLLFNDPKDPE